MEIDKAIRIFSDFLNSSWGIVIPLLFDRSYTSNESSISDWLQTNWEILVERKVLQLNEYLEFYGDGADYYGKSCRMTDIDAIPIFSIKVILDKIEIDDLLNKETLINTNFAFNKLVGFQNGFYINAPPFNYVLVQDEDIGIDRVLPLESIKFALHRI
jgi:hypothetical protein